MPFNFVEIDEPEAVIESFHAMDAEQMLVASAKSGNARAFEKLVKRYEPRLLALALRYARVHEDAEDVVQQTLQKAFVHLHRFEGKSRFSTWLMRIAINESLMLLRKKRALLEVSNVETVAVDGADLQLDFPDSDPSPEDNCFYEEQKRILSTALMQLSPRLRKTIELRELGDLSTEETARILGLSVGAVKGRLFHARKKLRKSLRRYAGSAWQFRQTPCGPSPRRRHLSGDRLICNACG